MPRIFTEKQLAGALHDLLGRMTTKDQSWIREAFTEDNSMVVDEFVSWASDRGIQIRDADVADWHKRASFVGEEAL